MMNVDRILDSSKEMPIAVSAEMAILGAYLIDPLTAAEQARGLEERMFSLDSHRRIFRSIARLSDEGREVAYNSVIDDLDRHHELDQVGNRPYLLELFEGQTHVFSLAEYVNTLQRTWKQRELLRLTTLFGRRAVDQGEDPDQLLGQLQAAVFDTMQEARVTTEDPCVGSFTDAVLEQTLDDSKPSMGFSFGHAVLDRATWGLQPGEVVVVGARSGIGKTNFLLQTAADSCRKGIGVDLFSLEMTKVQMLRRLLAMESRVPARSIQRKDLNGTDKLYLREAAQRIKSWNLRIHDNPELSLTEIAALARLSARRNGMQWFALDYIQIANADGKDDRTRVAAVSRTLTRLAKRENVGLMMLSQLSKPNQDRASKPPTVRDLRETGQIENDAHLVLLLHREWNEESARLEQNTQVIIAKTRNDEPGVVRARFNPERLTFDAA